MSNYSVAITDQLATGRYVQNDHFAANALQAVNVDPEGHNGVMDGFADAAESLGLNHFRYPGGATENVIDITRLEDGELREEVRRFMDWAVANGTEDNPGRVTVVLPTKTDTPPEQIETFVRLLLEEYGDHVEALEIGNEYSIGVYDAKYDREAHPEENPDGDYVSPMNEVDYGIVANRVINASLDAIETLIAEGHPNAHDPKILLQIGEPQGSASTYKRVGTFEQSNEAIVSMLDERVKAAVDGGVAHYYYNKAHTEDQSFDHSWREYRSLDDRIASFSEFLGHEVDLYITEWNVLASNYNQLGAANASILLEMFEFMVGAGVQDAFVWPLQHRTGSNIAGNRQVEEMELTMGGEAFAMMAASLRPQYSTETGVTSMMESIATDSTGSNGVVEVNLYSSNYADVLYVSLRDLDTASVTLDLAPFISDKTTSVAIDHMTIDTSTADGLSDMADDAGQNRIGRRYIEEDEYLALAELPFFDPTNKNHIQILDNGLYRTYLPTIESIIPLVANPQTIDDYYFATESDVSALITTTDVDPERAEQVTLDMMPYDVAQITITKSWTQSGTSGNDQLLGGIGDDVLLGRQGNDNMISGEGNDTLKGGWGDDLLEAGSGDDVIYDGDGLDRVLAGTGDDRIYLSTGLKIVDGGAGMDRAYFDQTLSEATITTDGTTVQVEAADLTARLIDVEEFRFADATVKVTDLIPPDVVRTQGTGADEALSGHAGRNLIFGGGGSDTVTGSEYLDVMVADKAGLFGEEVADQVFRLYKAAFNRTPDLEGHQTATGQLASGLKTLEDLTGEFINSTEFQTRYGDTDNAEFVTLMFNNVLGRDPAETGLRSWTAALDDGMSRAELLIRFSESAEHLNKTADALDAFEVRHDNSDVAGSAYRYFQAILGREPAEAGLQNWIEAHANGMSKAQMADALMGSQEYQTRFGETSDAEFVTRLYSNVLKRAPDAAGFDNWLAALEGGMARANVVRAFADSPEYQLRTADRLEEMIRAMGVDDILRPGAGDSLLSGGLYTDSFVFETVDAGTHRILDIEDWDILDLSDFGFTDFTDALGHFTQDEDTAVFEYEGVRIELADYSRDQISEDMLIV